MTTKQYIIYISLCTIPYLIATAVKAFLKHKLKNLEYPESGEVHSFTITPQNDDCWKHVMRKSKCSEECSYVYLQRIVKRVKDAKFEVLMCVNHLTINDIANAMIAAKERGVTVKCLTDMEMMKVTGSKIPILKSNDIPIRTQSKGNFNLHHKFFIIDGDQDSKMVCFGSLNFTMQGLTKNFEQVIETNNSRIVHRFRTEFQYLWENEKDF